jgi:acetyl esterase/lipase
LNTSQHSAISMRRRIMLPHYKKSARDRYAPAAPTREKPHRVVVFLGGGGRRRCPLAPALLSAQRYHINDAC